MWRTGVLPFQENSHPQPFSSTPLANLVFLLKFFHFANLLRYFFRLLSQADQLLKLPGYKNPECKHIYANQRGLALQGDAAEL